MPATAVTRSDTTKAIVKRTAVFIKEKRNGADVFIREPYDYVEYDRTHQSVKGPNQTFILFNGKMRPAPGGTEYRFHGNDSTTDVQEVYDEILVLDQRPSDSPNR